MGILAIVCLVLLALAALGASWFWRAQASPGNPWYGNAAFYWGVFLLALYITWPTVKALR